MSSTICWRSSVRSSDRLAQRDRELAAVLGLDRFELRIDAGREQAIERAIG
jgi:hypothetical protein